MVDLARPTKGKAEKRKNETKNEKSGNPTDDSGRFPQTHPSIHPVTHSPTNVFICLDIKSDPNVSFALAIYVPCILFQRSGEQVAKLVKRQICVTSRCERNQELHMASKLSFRRLKCFVWSCQLSNSTNQRLSKKSNNFYFNFRLAMCNGYISMWQSSCGCNAISYFVLCSMSFADGKVQNIKYKIRNATWASAAGAVKMSQPHRGTKMKP